MKREIKCCVCNKYLGEIRDAKIIKGISYLCPKCNKKRRGEKEGNTGSLNFLRKLLNI